MIPFNKPTYLGNEIECLKKVLRNNKLSGDGEFTLLCNKWFEENIKCKKAFITTSCTHALEISAILADIKEGDEVIMPSFTFVSTANAFVLRRAKIVFVDIRPDTMNIDENLIESAITSKTKAIVVMHYAGIACEMDKILSIAGKYNLVVIEDAAHSIMAKYKNKFLGTIGDIGTFSFHETKNMICGEGGAIIINDGKYIERAEIIREKGTNRSKFYRGEVEKYTWIDIGSSYLPGELNAAYLFAQLENADKILNERMKSWKFYYENLKQIAEDKIIEISVIPKDCAHNAHIFFIKTKNITERKLLVEFLKTKDIMTVYHYIPLHSSAAGIIYGRFNGKDVYTTKESERLLRLPLFYGITSSEISYVCENIIDFYKR
ncbi:MAG: dTDP-4-amino-4,6-dideoxygalactose transaminase [Bacteroidales bacterium]|nr:dTDP-4-amino-4,6-dideoxygalactose transaminase [Bacteroidales bacterium]